MPSFFNSWLPFIYLYGVGGFAFLIGMIIVTKSGSLNLKLKRHRKWFFVSIFGYFYFVFFHALWILAALYL